MTLQGQMRADAKMDPSYCALLVVSGIVASLGLEQNSAATIIGAMVVAPLMLPIRALGFGLAVAVVCCILNLALNDSAVGEDGRTLAVMAWCS